MAKRKKRRDLRQEAETKMETIVEQHNKLVQESYKVLMKD